MNNIVFLFPEGVVEIHVDPLDSERTIEIGGVEIPYGHANLGNSNLILQIPFKDLTVYDIASYEEMKNGQRGDS